MEHNHRVVLRFLPTGTTGVTIQGLGGGVEEEAPVKLLRRGIAAARIPEDWFFRTTENEERVAALTKVRSSRNNTYMHVIDSDGTGLGSGNISSGQLGVGVTSGAFLQPTPIVFDAEATPAGPIAAFGGGSLWTYAIDDAGKCYFAGSQMDGYAGLGSFSSYNAFIDIGPFGGEQGGVVSTADGQYHSILVREDGSAWGVGYNISWVVSPEGGDFGNFASISTFQRYDVPDGHKIIQAAACNRMTILLSDTGKVWFQGENQWGLGLGQNSNTLTDATTLSQWRGATDDVTFISAASEKAALVRSDGTVWIWGRNPSTAWAGAPDSWTEGESIYRLIQTDLTDVEAVAVGDECTLALKKDGTVWGAGILDHLGGPTNTQTWTQLTGLGTVLGFRLNSNFGDTSTAIFMIDNTTSVPLIGRGEQGNGRLGTDATGFATTNVNYGGTDNAVSIDPAIAKALVIPPPIEFGVQAVGDASTEATVQFERLLGHGGNHGDWTVTVQEATPHPTPLALVSDSFHQRHSVDSARGNGLQQTDVITIVGSRGSAPSVTHIQPLQTGPLKFRLETLAGGTPTVTDPVGVVLQITERG